MKKFINKPQSKSKTKVIVKNPLNVICPACKGEFPYDEFNRHYSMHNIEDKPKSAKYFYLDRKPLVQKPVIEVRQRKSGRLITKFEYGYNDWEKA